MRNFFVTAAALMVIAVIALLATSILFPESIGRHSHNFDATYEQIRKEISLEH